MLKYLYSIVLLVLGHTGLAQVNANCAGMAPICTDAGLSFTSNANVSGSEPGNDYGCLGSQPNPSWYYFEIATNGNIDMSLSAGSDIDFIIYGPFTSLADAQNNCGSLGDPTNSPIVDCSYSPTNMETPTIPNAVVGEVYILLITNFANIVQDITLTQTGGTGSTDCSIVPPCDASVGTFTLYKNNVLVTAPMVLCEGDSFEIRSDNNFILPADTIAGPTGDGVYTAQLMFLVYDALPSGNDPLTDPGYTQLIIPEDSLFDINDAQSTVITTLGCGTYYFVPVTADDGIGQNNNVVGINDNGIIFWDTDGNGCYQLGDPIEITYTCDLTPTPVVNCTGLNNGVDFNFPVNGDYIVTNTGNGSLLSNTVTTPAPAQIENLFHNQTYSILAINQDGCVTNISGQFVTPAFADVSILPGPDCPGTGNGEVRVEGVANSGNGGIASIVMNGIVENTTVPFDTLAAPVGAVVFTRLIDQSGCYRDTSVTVTSVGHEVVIELTASSEVLCYGDQNGSATINAYTIGANGQPDNVPLAGIEWTYIPTGASTPGPATFTTNNGLQAGVWIVTVTDVNGCAGSLSFEIGTPDSLTIFVESFSTPVCVNQSNGSINLGYNGGTVGSGSVYDWTGPITVPTTSQTANGLPAGNYFVTLTDDNGCTASASQTITQPLAIDATFSTKDVLCYGDSTGQIVVQDVINAKLPFLYSWEVPGSGVQLPSASFLNNVPAGVYSLEITDANGCTNSWDFTISQSDSLYIETLIARPAYCRTGSNQNGSGELSIAASGGAGNFDFLWEELKTGATTNTATWAARNPGNYHLTITDGFDCSIETDVFLDSINPKAVMVVTSDDFEGPELYEGTEPLKVRFQNQSFGYADSLNPAADTVFQWSFNRNPTDGSDPNWFFTFSEDTRVDTTYAGEGEFIACLVVKNYNDCADTTCVKIISRAEPRLTLPNVFTPGAAPNSEFFFPNVGLNEFKAVVFNRYGIPVFEFNDITDKWDGTHKDSGNECSDGVYYYTYSGTSTNGTEFKGEGTVTLLRNKE